MFNTTCHLAPVGSHHWLSRDNTGKVQIKAFCYKREVRSGYVAGFERGQTWQGVFSKPPPTTDADGYFPHQERELLCSYTCRVVPRYSEYTNTLYIVTCNCCYYHCCSCMARSSLIHKCFYDIIHAIVLHKFVMEVSNIYTVGKMIHGSSSWMSLTLCITQHSRIKLSSVFAEGFVWYF